MARFNRYRQPIADVSGRDMTMRISSSAGTDGSPTKWLEVTSWRSLIGDVPGNVLALTAAVLPVLLVLTGGATDMGRAYLTQTSLQSACDGGGFGLDLTDAMTTCASSGRAFKAGDTKALENTFRYIASQVADLRLKS